MFTGSQPTRDANPSVPALRRREPGVPSTTRRKFLVGVGTTAAVGLLAGCLSDKDDDSLPAPVAGDPDGAVTLQVFSDFACPHCRTYHLSVFPTLNTGILEDGGVRYEHHDFPIPVDQVWSWRIASAARAAQAAAGDEAFWDISEGLYQHQGEWSGPLLERLGDDVGTDGAAVRSAGMQEQYRDVVEVDRTLGEELGVPGTPAIMLDDQLISPSAEAVEQAVTAAR